VRDLKPRLRRNPAPAIQKFFAALFFKKAAAYV